MSRTRCTKSQVLAALTEAKGTQFLAAKRLGVDARTMRRYLERWPELRETMADARGELVDIAELKLWTLVQDGNWKAIAFTLVTQGKDRGYSQKLQLEHKGKVEVEVKEIVITSREEAKMALGLIEQEKRVNLANGEAG